MNKYNINNKKNYFISASETNKNIVHYVIDKLRLFVVGLHPK